MVFLSFFLSICVCAEVELTYDKIIMSKINYFSLSNHVEFINNIMEYFVNSSIILLKILILIIYIIQF
jgi:hypothetical protein